MTVSYTMIFYHLSILPFDSILSQFNLIKIIKPCCPSQIHCNCCHFIYTVDPSGRVVESSVVGVYRGLCDRPSLVQRSPTQCGVSKCV